MSDNTFLTALGNGSQTKLKQDGTTVGRLSATAAEDQLKESVAKLFGGDQAFLQKSTSFNLDNVYGSAPHSSLGLQVAIAGRASVVQADVAAHLLEYTDPIRSILGASIADSHRVIVKRRFVMGGDAEIIPERAPGRTLSVKEEEREVALGRYGADLEMNTNLLLEPALAKADLDIKLDYQKGALERKLTELGYEAVMREGTDLVRALYEANPISENISGDKEKLEVMDRLYATSIFGAMQKHSQPIANLLAAAKKAGTMAAGAFDTMIVPSGLPELLQWGRAENVYYYLNGRSIDAKERIQFGLDGGRVDPSSGLKVFTTYPQVDYTQGTAYQSAKQSPIMKKVKIGMLYFLGASGEGYIVNPQTGVMEKVGAGSGDANKVFVREVECLMSSAILAKSGSNTGELLMAYPNTAFTNDNTSPEVFKLQLRVYLGAAVYQARQPDCGHE